MISSKIDLPDFKRWEKNGIKSKLAGVIIAPEDYYEGNKKYFTWDEAIIAQKKMPKGWRIPTMQEWVLLCEEFGRIGSNEEYNAELLCKNLRLEKNGFVAQNNMDRYNESYNETYETVIFRGAGGYFWSTKATSATEAIHLGLQTGVHPNSDSLKGYGLSVRCLLETE